MGPFSRSTRVQNTLFTPSICRVGKHGGNGSGSEEEEEERKEEARLSTCSVKTRVGMRPRRNTAVRINVRDDSARALPIVDVMVRSLAI